MRDSIEEVGESQHDAGKNDSIWGEISENLEINTIDEDPWALNEVQKETISEPENLKSVESTAITIENLPQSEHDLQKEKTAQIEPIVGLRYRQRLDLDFQNLIEITATLIVLACRFFVASIVSISIVLMIISVYAAAIVGTIYFFIRIYYFFTSDSEAAGVVGGIASAIGEKIIDLLGMIVSLFGDLIQSFSSNLYCQGALGFIVLILLLSSWTKKAILEFKNYTEKAGQYIESWWEWAYLPLKTLRGQEEEE